MLNKRNSMLFLILISTLLFAQDMSKTFNITQNYLNFPIQSSQDRQKVTFELDGKPFTYSVMRLTQAAPDYWVYMDVSKFKGKQLSLTFDKKSGGYRKNCTN